MRAIGRRFLSLAAGCALGCLSIASATAQSAPGLNPATLDVVGIRLGMTPSQVVVALKKFDPHLKLAQDFFSDPQYYYGQTGAPKRKDMGAEERATSYFNDVSAVDEGNPPPETICQQGGLYCNTEYFDNREKITVWFSPVPGHEHVIAVKRSKTFIQKKEPPLASLERGAFTKYPESQATFDRHDDSTHLVDWVFDGRGRLLSANSARSKGFGPENGIPGHANPGDGVGLNMDIESDSQNPELATSLSVTLYNSDALFRSIGQSQTTYKALKAKFDAKQVSKAAKTQGQTKF